MVGESAQATYGWRGAQDVVAGHGAAQPALTRSFCFGPQFSKVNRWLALADTPVGPLSLSLSGPSTSGTTRSAIRSPVSAVPHLAQ